MSPAATYENPSAHPVNTFILPDLVSACPYPYRLNPHCDDVSRASEQWFLQGARLDEPSVAKFMGLKAAVLCAAGYPKADAFHLRVISDFQNWFFMLDDWSDEFDVMGARGMRDACISAYDDPINFETDKFGAQMCKSYFSRFIQTAGPGCKKRFIRAMELFFDAIARESDDRANGRIPDVESYIALRRDTSGCKPSFAFIEFAARIDLPDEVLSHPVIRAMEDASNDLIGWSNDLYSYNIEQARREIHNMIAVLMREEGLDLQDAVDHVGELCKGTIQRFEDNRAILPSWGEEVDKQVALYIQGMQNWMAAAVHWSFVSERYFGTAGQKVKHHRVIELLPQRPL